MADSNPKLCNGWWGFREMSFAEFCRASAGLRLEYVEVDIRGRSSERHHLNIVASDDEVRQCLSEASDAGVTIACATISNDFTVDDPAQLRTQLETAKRLADVAARCGAGVLRVFAGFTPFESLTTRTYESCASSLRELGESCSALGLLVALENHGGITATAAQVRRLLTLADHPNVRANFDPGNFAYCREDPLAAWMVLHDLVGYAHFKDVQVRNSALQYCSLGDGVTDWPPLIEAMLRDDYHGYWAIEYEEPSDCVQGTERCLQVLRTAVGRPASVGR